MVKSSVGFTDPQQKILGNHKSPVDTFSQNAPGTLINLYIGLKLFAT